MEPAPLVAHRKLDAVTTFVACKKLISPEVIYKFSLLEFSTTSNRQTLLIVELEPLSDRNGIPLLEARSVRATAASLRPRGTLRVLDDGEASAARAAMAAREFVVRYQRMGDEYLPCEIEPPHLSLAEVRSFETTITINRPE